MADIVIIGGGIAGLSVAGRLGGKANVTLLEAEPSLGYHTSGRSAALYEAEYGLASTIALNRASGDYHRGNGYLSPRGMLLLAGHEDRMAFETDTATLRTEVIGVDDAVKMVPILDPEAVAFASYHEAAFDLDTDRMMQDFARQSRAAGGRIVTGARVSDIRREDGRWQVRAGEETHSADILVNAAGAWADTVARLAGARPVGLTPLRRSMARIAAPGGHDLRAWPMIFGPGESWYAKPDAGALLVSPAEEDPVEPMDAWPDDMVLAEGLARYQEMVREPVTRPLATWAGLRTFAPDRQLVIGFDPALPDFFWLAGQGGYGMQTAPAASALAAALLTGGQPEIEAAFVEAFSPARFHR